MNDSEFNAWNRSKRAEAISYLERQGIKSPRIGDWPAFEMAPHFAIWCVESQRHPGRIGWWVFAGDCPIDYVAEDGRCHPRAALQNLLKRWNECVPWMKAGEQPPDVKFPESANLPELGVLLEKRTAILQEWLKDDDLWEDR